MNQLMIYVERIVRPVGATQSRKLRMRLELLAHLEATVDEERDRSPGDDREVIERAKLRLGEPRELTKNLQQSVPLVERWLLVPLPLSRRFDYLEHRMPHVPGQPGALTLTHQTILTALVFLGCAPLFLSMLMVTTPGAPAIHLKVALAGMIAGLMSLLFASHRFIFASAAPGQHWDWPDTLRRSATLVAMQIGLMFFAAFAIADRPASLAEIMTCAASTLALLAISTLIARGIGVLRRPYDEWLTLDIA